MSYQVIARKWRPGTFDEVTGQEPITRTLKNAIEHERLHHAYLFSGARGVGKTTTARLLAKALNCHKSKKPTPTPCAIDDPTACASCREIAEGLRQIADAEKVKISNDALREIARAGEGSMRDAQSAFDQVISFSGAEIRVEDVETALGLASTEMLSRVMNAVAEQKPSEALAVVNDLVMRGHDLRNFCRDLLGHVRDLLVAKVSGEAAELLDTAATTGRELARQANSFSESDLVRFFHSLTETENNLRVAAHPRYQLEVGLVKLIEMRRIVALTDLIERLNALEESLRTGAQPVGGKIPPAAAGGGAQGKRTGTGGFPGASTPRASSAVKHENTDVA